MGNLRCGSYLPVEVFAGNLRLEGRFYSVITGIHLYFKGIPKESKHGHAKSEVLCCTQELKEVWNGKVELMEELDVEVVKERHCHLRKNRFQVSAGTPEPKLAKVRKCNISDDRPIQQLSLHVTVGNRVVKGNHECLELGQK